MQCPSTRSDRKAEGAHGSEFPHGVDRQRWEESPRGAATLLCSVPRAPDSLDPERDLGLAFLTTSYTLHFENLLLHKKMTVGSHMLGKERI